MPKKALPVLGSTMDLVKKRSAGVFETTPITLATASASRKIDLEKKRLPDIKESDESDKNDPGWVARQTIKKKNLPDKKKESDESDGSKPTGLKKTDLTNKNKSDKGEDSKPSWATKRTLRPTNNSIKGPSKSSTKVSDTEDDTSSGKPSWINKILTPVESQSRAKSDTEEDKQGHVMPSWYKSSNTTTSSTKPRGTQYTARSLCEDEQNNSEADSSEEEEYYDIINYSDTDSGDF